MSPSTINPALAAALALATVPSGYGRGLVAPPSKKKPAKVERNRAKAKAARKERKRQRRAGR